MYLIDTNIFLEIFLHGEGSEDAKRFLSRTSFSDLYVTDLTLYTLGMVLFKYDRHTAYIQLLNDLFVKGQVWRIQLVTENMEKVSQITQKYHLSFNDAYQYASSEIYDLTLVTYNQEYDRTERGRKTPIDILNGT